MQDETYICWNEAGAFVTDCKEVAKLLWSLSCMFGWSCLLCRLRPIVHECFPSLSLSMSVGFCFSFCVDFPPFKLSSLSGGFSPGFCLRVLLCWFFPLLRFPAKGNSKVYRFPWISPPHPFAAPQRSLPHPFCAFCHSSVCRAQWSQLGCLAPGRYRQFPACCPV